MAIIHSTIIIILLSVIIYLLSRILENDKVINIFFNSEDFVNNIYKHQQRKDPEE